MNFIERTNLKEEDKEKISCHLWVPAAVPSWLGGVFSAGLSRHRTILEVQTGRVADREDRLLINFDGLAG